LVIGAHAETVPDLEDALRLRSGNSTPVFPEDVSIVERPRAAADFAEEEFGARRVMCAEIGSEGRNFQSAHLLALYDRTYHP
ncbi:hypothetical protein ACV357_34130, partial [Pseudomonas aeruginosa]